MNRLLLSLIVFTSTSNLRAQDFEILIRNGLVLDGTGSPEFRADVGISGDEIVALGKLTNATARRVIDASGLYVVPGFIGMHSHADRGFVSQMSLTPTLPKPGFAVHNHNSGRVLQLSPLSNLVECACKKPSWRHVAKVIDESWPTGGPGATVGWRKNGVCPNGVSGSYPLTWSAAAG